MKSFRTPQSALRTFFAVLCLLSSALWFAGCGTLDPAGPYKGDEVLYKADMTITTAYDALHGFVSWEYQNRAALASKPEIKKAADNVRVNARQWIDSAIALREAYAANPTNENRDALQKTLGIIRAALNEAVKYMNANAPEK